MQTDAGHSSCFTLLPQHRISHVTCSQEGDKSFPKCQTVRIKQRRLLSFTVKINQKKNFTIKLTCSVVGFPAKTSSHILGLSLIHTATIM